MFMYGFSCLRFLSRFSKTGLGIVPFGGTRELHTYTFKQPILANAAYFFGGRTGQNHSRFGVHLPGRLRGVLMEGGMARGTVPRGIDFGIGEAIPYVLVEVPAFGFGLQQLPIDLFGNAGVTVDRPAPKLQFQNGALIPVGNGIQRGGL
jgi:hypothetical protein